MFKALFRSVDCGDRYILAAPIPISPYKTNQTIGKRIAGGDRGGFGIFALKSFIPSFDNQPESAPMDSVRRIHNAYGFRVFIFTDIHPKKGYDEVRQGIPVPNTQMADENERKQLSPKSMLILPENVFWRVVCQYGSYVIII